MRNEYEYGGERPKDPAIYGTTEGKERHKSLIAYASNGSYPVLIFPVLTNAHHIRHPISRPRVPD